MSPQDLQLLLKQRRSTFPAQYTGEKIDDSIVWQILQNATFAPTHGKTEPWHFTVFTGEGRQKFADFQATLYKNTNSEDTFENSKYQKLLSNPLQASHIIAIAMKRLESAKIPPIEDEYACACAIQNIYLSATAYGLGGFWSTGGMTYRPEAKPFLGLGEQDKLLGFFYLGVIAKPSNEFVRKPVQEKTTWVSNL